MNKLLLSIAVVAGLAAFAGTVAAEPVRRDALTIDHPYATPTPPGATTGAAYVGDVANTGPEADALIGATSPAAERVEMHRMRMDGDVMRMRAVSEVAVPAGAHVALTSAGGHHLMLIGLRKPLVVGDQVPLKLRFRRAGDVDVVLSVEPRTAGGGSGAPHRH